MMRSRIYKYLGYTICLLSVSMISYIASLPVYGQIATPDQCDLIYFTVDGVNQTEANHTYQYTIAPHIQKISTGDREVYPPSIPSDRTGFLDFIHNEASVRYTILQDRRVQQSIAEKRFFYAFPTAGDYTIRANITLGSCVYTIEKPITVYTDVYMYMGTFVDDFNFGVINNIRQSDRLLHTFITSEEMHNNPSLITTNIIQHIPYVESADDIFINMSNYAQVFDVLALLQRDYNIDMNQKKIFLVSDLHKSVIKKFLAKFIKQTNITSIHVITKEQLTNVFLNLSVGKDGYSSELFEASAISFDEDTIIFSLGYVVDYLVFHGFPLDTVELFLGVLLAILLIVFIKQVIGFSSFGVYYPILFALSLHTVGLKTSIGLLLVAFLTKVIVGLFTNRFMLLFSAKFGLYIVVYVFLSLISFTLYRWIVGAGADFSIFQNPMIVIVSIMMFMVGKKVWPVALPFLQKKWRGNMFRFLFLSWVVYVVISSAAVQLFLLAYPAIIFIIILLIIVLGRYTGLQLIEYIRFWPLIKHLQKKK